MIRDRNKNNLRTIEALIVRKLKNNEPRPKLLVLIKKACKLVKTATYRHEKERKICNSKFHCCSRSINKFGEPLKTYSTKSSSYFVCWYMYAFGNLRNKVISSFIFTETVKG